MDVSFKKDMKSLEREVLMKSVDLEDNIDEFTFELNDFHSEEEIIAVAPKCCRCNMCVEVCPVDAIEKASIYKIAKITDACVKCEICVQTCPITAIKVINNAVFFNTEDDNNTIEYNLVSNSKPHRIVRMEEINVDYSKCLEGGDCSEFCPTGALTAEFKEYFEDKKIEIGIELLEDTLYPALNRKLCIGCGACVETCDGDYMELKRIVGPVIYTRNLLINQDICVNCYLCEDNCPTEAIKLDEGKVVLDNDKCIRCIVCTDHCPVGALKLVDNE